MRLHVIQALGKADVIEGRVEALSFHRRWAWPERFAIEQHEVRHTDWMFLRLEQRGARTVDWRRPSQEGWRRLVGVTRGEAWLGGRPLAPGRWHDAPFGDAPLISSHEGTLWMVASRAASFPPSVLRLFPSDAEQVEALLRTLSGPSSEVTPAEAPFAKLVAALTDRLDASPAESELAHALGTDERRVSEAAREYFTRFHATVKGWRHYLRALRLELAVSAFSAGCSTNDVARWLGFRAATALLHSMQKAGLPSPQRFRDAEKSGSSHEALTGLLSTAER